MTFLGCPLLSEIENWHYAQPITPNLSRIDSVYLRLIVEHGGSLNAQSTCTYIGHTIAKRDFCRMFSCIPWCYSNGLLIVLACDHPQGSGKVVTRKCQVRFDFFIPLYWARFPFIIMVTRGSHTHHPPLPEKLPKDIAQQVISAIEEQELLSLTARKFSIHHPSLFRSWP